MKTLTYEELCNRIDGADSEASRLQRQMIKVNAGESVRQLMVDMGYPYPESKDIPEMDIRLYCERLDIGFDEKGNILSIQLPFYIEDIVYEKRYDEILRMDLEDLLEGMVDNEELDADIYNDDVDGMISLAMNHYKHFSYNVSRSEKLASSIAFALKSRI